MGEALEDDEEVQEEPEGILASPSAPSDISHEALGNLGAPGGVERGTGFEQWAAGRYQKSPASDYWIREQVADGKLVRWY